ncbi:MAG: hypothetical protein IT518_29355 [Burkholderiales bacterium]|nr:hypothetical protein [Burkholderiales bacterium]
MNMDRTRLARLLFLAGALGEMGVGVIGLAWPRILSLLLDVTLDAGGLLVARMLAAAALAIGLTWWLARKDPDALARNAGGFLVYNFGIGALFLLQAFAAARPLIPALLGVVHVGAGLGFLALRPRQRP